MAGLEAYLTESAIALAGFFALHRAFLKSDTHFRASRVYLLGTLLAAFALPFVHVTSPFSQAVASPGPLDDLETIVTSSAGWEWRRVVFGVYAAGAIWVLVRLGWRLWCLLRATQRLPVVRQAGIRVVYVEDDCPPFSFFRTAFVHRPAAGDDPVLAPVVAHERAHIRQGHSFDIVLVQIAASAQWFNPFVWLYGSALRELHEYLADREVLAEGFDPSVYKRVLVEQHVGASSFAFAHHLRQSQIKRRLAMLTRQSGPWALCRYLLALPALALLVVAFAEPPVAAADRAVAIDTVAAGSPVVSPVVTGQDQAKKQQAAQGNGDAKKVEKTKAEVDLEKKMTVLKAEYEATSDPEVRKTIKAKMKQIQEAAAASNGGPDLDDPVAVESAFKKASKKLEMLEAKIRETADPAAKEILQKDAENLAKKREFLKARLAQLQNGK